MKTKKEYPGQRRLGAVIKAAAVACLIVPVALAFAACGTTTKAKGLLKQAFGIPETPAVVAPPAGTTPTEPGTTPIEPGTEPTTPATPETEPGTEPVEPSEGETPEPVVHVPNPTINRQAYQAQGNGQMEFLPDMTDAVSLRLKPNGHAENSCFYFFQGADIVNGAAQCALDYVSLECISDMNFGDFSQVRVRGGGTGATVAEAIGYFYDNWANYEVVITRVMDGTTMWSIEYATPGCRFDMLVLDNVAIDLSDLGAIMLDRGGEYFVDFLDRDGLDGPIEITQTLDPWLGSITLISSVMANAVEMRIVMSEPDLRNSSLLVMSHDVMFELYEGLTGGRFQMVPFSIDTLTTFAPGGHEYELVISGANWKLVVDGEVRFDVQREYDLRQFDTIGLPNVQGLTVTITSRVAA
jgi:hypothetical protein